MMRSLVGILVLAMATPALGQTYPMQEPYPTQEPYPYVQPNEYEDTDPSALVDFRPVLESHGTWIDHPQWGTVWIPNAAEVGRDFVPYASGGRWVYQNDWIWVSDYDWGWAPFHYGRWVFVDGVGWAWIPGRRYSGAWVDWETGDAPWIGWAPAPPRFIWRNNYAVSLSTVPSPRWVVCPRESVFAPRVSRYTHYAYSAPSIQSRLRPYTRSWNTPIARPYVRGPDPRSMRVTRIVAPPANDRALERARLYAQPTTAQRFGARMPTPHFVAPSTQTPNPRPQIQPREIPQQRVTPQMQPRVIPQQRVTPPMQPRVTPAPMQTPPPQVQPRVAPPPQQRVAPPPMQQRITPPPVQRVTPPSNSPSSPPPPNPQRRPIQAPPARR